MIVNGDDVYVAEGSMINLTCIITQSRVEHVFWYHEEKVGFDRIFWLGWGGRVGCMWGNHRRLGVSHIIDSFNSIISYKIENKIY